MKKLIYSAAAAVALVVGAPVLAQDAEQQAGSAWRTTPDTNPIPGSYEYYNNSGGPVQGPGYVRRDGTWVPAPQYRQYSPAPAYPYSNPDRRSRRDRDGDGVANRSDRYPDNPYRQ